MENKKANSQKEQCPRNQSPDEPVRQEIALEKICYIYAPARRSMKGLVVFALQVGGLLLAFVEFPGAVDDVGVDSVGVLHGHFHVGESEFRRIGETGHAFAPVRTAEDGRIPIFVRLGGHVTQIGNDAVFGPGAGAVEAGRMATVANERSIKFFSLLDHFWCAGLRWRKRNRRNDYLRRWEWSFSIELEGIDARRT